LDVIVGVTGTPGTGKKSVAPRLAKLIGAKCMSLNEVARSFGLLTKRGAEWEVDADRLRTRLDVLAGPSVLYGHLLPYSVDPQLVSHVVVLRCEPKVLKRRLLGRGYPPRKVMDNVESELIGLVSSEAFEAFGERRTFEVDTSEATPESAARLAKRVMEGVSRPGPRVDWTLAYDTGRKLRSLLSTGTS
jgi:adenylate kinase